MINFTLFLSLLNSPSLIFEMFPFILLITIQLFFIKLFENKEIEIFKYSGLKNSSIIIIILSLSLITGVLVVSVFYNLSSNLKNFYLDLKTNYTKDDKYLAVITKNGLWIKEEIDGYSNIIHARKFNKNKIEDITITQTNAATENINIITAKNADISSKTWSLNEVKIVDKLSGSNKYDNIKYLSSFDGEIISNLFL